MIDLRAGTEFPSKSLLLSALNSYEVSTRKILRTARSFTDYVSVECKCPNCRFVLKAGRHRARDGIVIKKFVPHSCRLEDHLGERVGNNAENLKRLWM